MVWVCLPVVGDIDCPVGHGFGWLARTGLSSCLFSIPGVANSGREELSPFEVWV